MAHVPQPAAQTTGPYGDAVARIETIRHALKVGEDFGAGPAPDLVVGAASAGLEALTAIGEQTATAEASREMVERIRRELAEISKIVLR
jgi:hypothetical protein